jgi:hypothetical protein
VTIMRRNTLVVAKLKSKLYANSKNATALTCGQIIYTQLGKFNVTYMLYVVHIV